MDPLRNKLLADMSRLHLDVLLTKGTWVSFAQSDVVQREEEEVDAVYFPVSGMLSLLVVMRDGQTIETSVIGREGAVGSRAGFGLYVSRVRIVAQLPVDALRISASDFRKLVASSNALRDLCLKEQDALVDQAGITAACNSRHIVEERFSRWLLHTADRAENDSFAITQDLLSVMLGVRRTTVTNVAKTFQDRGIIQYARGKLQILDRAALERAACECYETLKRH